MLVDPITLNIHIEMSTKNDLPTGVIGATLPIFELNQSYSNVRNSLVQDAVTSSDRTATQNLETGSTWSATTDWLDSSKTVNINKVSMTRANSKALGIINGQSSRLDGVLVFNDLVGTSASWQYDYYNGAVGTSNLDFTTVAIHELAHVMGFISVVDGMSNSNPDSNFVSNGATTFDLFRYKSNNINDPLATTYRILDQGYTAFSIDRGFTNLASFANGLQYGTDGNVIDSFQASHWYRNSTSQTWSTGIMDPYLSLNTRRAINTNDLKVLDVIGWDIKSEEVDYSVDRIHYTDNAAATATAKGSVNRNAEISTELQNWGWARGGSSGTLTQQGNVGQFLAQQGFFAIGAFHETIDCALYRHDREHEHEDMTHENATQIHQIGDNFLTLIDEHFANNQELTKNFYLGSSKQLGKPEIDSTLTNNNYRDEVVNNQAKSNSITQWLAESENKQLNLDDLRQLLQEPELVKLVVENLDN